METRTRWLAPFAMLLATTALPAQLRKPCFLTVIDAEDHPLANAEVTLAWSRGTGWPGTADVVRAQTDARGRCRPALLPGQFYCAWAIGPAKGDGSREVSAPIGHIATGTVSDVLALYTWKPHVVKLDLSAALPAASRPRLRFFVDPELRVGTDLTVGEDGGATLPPAPWARMQFALCDDAGSLWQLTEVVPGDAAPTVTFAAPQLVNLRVTGDGKPLATASATPCSLRADQVLAVPSVTLRADADGSIVLPMCFAARNPACAIVNAPEHAAVYLYGSELQNKAGKPIEVVLPAARHVVGHLRGRRPDEAAVVRARLNVKCRGGFDIGVLLDIAVDGDELHSDLPANTVGSQFVVTLQPQGNGVPRCAILPFLEGPLESLPNLDLARLRTFRVRVVDASGAPAPQAVITLLPCGAATKLALQSEQVSILADQGGRAELACGDSDYALLVNNDGASAWTTLPSEQKSGDVLLTLQPLPKVRFRVVDADGVPVRDARIVRDRSVRPARFTVNQGAEGWTKRRLSWPLAEDLLSRPRSDAKGWIEVPIQDLWSWNEDIHLVAGARQSEPLGLQAGADLGDIVVR